MGVDSGLPDFRGKDGFWREYPHLRNRNIDFEEMANPAWFSEDPHFAWGFYGHRLNLYRSSKPHRGFALLQKWIRTLELESFVFTSNVDGHFQKSGFAEDFIYECHGSIFHLQCHSGCGQGIWPVSESFHIELDHENVHARNPLPSCPSCHGLARPNILMFGDFYWDSKRTSEQEREMEKWLRTHGTSELFVLEIGAGLSIPTVRMTCEREWKTSGGFFLRVNPRDHLVPAGAHSVAIGAEATLCAIEQKMSFID